MQPTDPTHRTDSGRTGHIPYVPPPPGGPPTPPPFGPLPPAVPPPPAPGASADGSASIRVAVTNRILWVGQAAYPLANVARVGTTLIVPGRRRALLRLLGFTLAVIVLAYVSSLATRSSSSLYDGGSSSDSGAGPVLGAVITVAVYFLIFTWPVLRRPDLHVLTVDTAGPPTAVLAWRIPQPAFELQATITRAIENPQAEFQQIVQSISVDLRQYQFGDSVNIYGGQGNTGVSK
ncbi:hypothetical protein BX285_4160 [Streptomyces sp. 1114.5]|uniref:DUF6232 family protein n=1 Tax=unclassified Streptomyces TaxID=2593676 RepID=UPI000BC9AA98|nr:MULTISPECIES: DUF6232 family protein [unclassified Streptomyces]RKT19691.1 hypothetical protein BX285_4160 [Streptomyces sp. 1114.5]SOB85890.1 hypothetical protein SAMN06272789_6191 [Streptomyces sp. 1331.2]